MKKLAIIGYTDKNVYRIEDILEKEIISTNPETHKIIDDICMLNNISDYRRNIKLKDISPNDKSRKLVEELFEKKVIEGSNLVFFMNFLKEEGFEFIFYYMHPLLVLNDIFNNDEVDGDGIQKKIENWYLFNKFIFNFINKNQNICEVHNVTSNMLKIFDKNNRIVKCGEGVDYKAIQYFIFESYITNNIINLYNNFEVFSEEKYDFTYDKSKKNNIVSEILSMIRNNNQNEIINKELKSTLTLMLEGFKSFDVNDNLIEKSIDELNLDIMIKLEEEINKNEILNSLIFILQDKIEKLLVNNKFLLEKNENIEINMEEKIKNSNEYILGNMLVTAPKNIKDLISLPSKVISKVGELKENDNNSIYGKVDDEQQIHACNHLSYKLGKTIYHSEANVKSIITLPKLIIKDLYEFKFKKTK